MFHYPYNVDYAYKLQTVRTPYLHNRVREKTFAVPGPGQAPSYGKCHNIFHIFFRNVCGRNKILLILQLSLKLVIK